MGLKPDTWIRAMAEQTGMIEPFVDHQVREGVISYGLSSYGYDIRVSDEFRLFRPHGEEEVVDPKALGPEAFEETRGEHCIIPPSSIALARTVEYFRIPRDVLTLCLGKSSYARCGVLVNVTPFEPEWEGHATLQIANTSPRPCRVHAGEGIAQVVFLQGDEPCETSYADRKGKYQGQRGITLPRL